MGLGLAVDCAALVRASARVWLLMFCLRIGKTVGSTQFFLFVSGMSADIYIYWSLLIIHIDAIALCWFARLNSFFGFVVLLSVSGMSADIFIYQSLLILHIDAIALCWFARLNPWSVPTGRLCGWNVGGWVCADVGTSSADLKSINLLTMKSLRRGGQQAALSLGFTLWTPR